MARLGSWTIPAFVWFIFWLLLVIILIILAALVVHALGGFDLHLRAGHFVFQIAVT
jgi:hypothetical protein